MMMATTASARLPAAAERASCQAPCHPRRPRGRRAGKGRIARLARDLFEGELTVEELAGRYRLPPERLCRIIDGKLQPGVMRLVESLAAAARKRSQLQLAHLQEKSVSLMNRALADRPPPGSAEGAGGGSKRSGRKRPRPGDRQAGRPSTEAEATGAAAPAPAPAPAPARKTPSASSLAVAKEILQRAMDIRGDAPCAARTRRAAGSPEPAPQPASAPKWPPSASEREKLLAQYGGPSDRSIPD